MSSLSDRDTYSDVAKELAYRLRMAALDVASDGRPELGAAYLRQALALLPAEAARGALADLANLESRYDMRSAVEHFDALLAEHGSWEILAEAASALLALNPSTRDPRAWQIAREAIAECDDPDLRLMLLARIGVSAALAVDAGDWRDQIVDELRCDAAESAGEKAALGVTVFVDLWRGQPLALVRERAQALFRGDWAASLQENNAAYGLGMTALLTSDSPLAAQAVDEALSCARRRSASGYEGGILALRAHLRLRAGDLAGAASDGHRAFETYRAYGGGPVPLAYAVAAIVEAERQRGDLGAAQRALALAPSDAAAGTLGLPGICLARARVRAAGRAHEVALAELLRIGARYEQLGGGGAALLPWRSEAALIAAQIGEQAQACELADAEIMVAADAGPRALGRALTARAAITPAADRGADVSQAVALLECVDAPLELTAALITQAQATAAAGTPALAREQYARGLKLAERTGARPLASAARDGLVAVGGRPRRAASVGIDGLTASERAVAHAAAGGLSNREIAATLHLAPGTVKNQLASVYRKLGVSSRSQLAGTLERR